jgi:hypothetical protein
VDHRAGKVQALKPHGTASMGLRRFPGDKVVAALAAIDTLMFFHESASPDRFYWPCQLVCHTVSRQGENFNMAAIIVEDIYQG